ncbi:Retrovirus-related Pol polyprotein from type-2 retrotransposable element R2DM; Endonuclease [Eumeta japonica]|uniref:Retrovirus-related Pol polyprotein from type-2 retrotransposable element R2DM Endonuclease n=1 Tax=Eumeta variegata TaxID=151549 RepID=A0A4C1UD69_EUMVA|nr:Retrovirus-related Pol polyprotein from type-2 retrotransposable element R2DM; Endonuclease [Eumeta japonica]
MNIIKNTIRALAYNKAFDSLEHDYIWEELRSQGVQEKYIRILMNVFSKSTAQIRLETTGEEFPIEKGVRQGDPVSPKLFSAALEMIFRNLDWNENGLNINGENLNHLRFADDLILFSKCPIKLEQMLQQLSNFKVL